MPHAGSIQKKSLVRGGYAVSGVVLRGVVCAVPGQPIDNSKFSELFDDKAIRDIVRMVGVKTRYNARPDQTSADLCYLATERLLEQLDWATDSLDALIFVSQTPDHILPASACLLHGRLKLAPYCQAFDVSLGCSGYVYGLWLASTLIQAGCRRVLLLAGETSSRIVDCTDRGTSILFGDAGSATAIEAKSDVPSLHFRLGTDGMGSSALVIPDGGFRPFSPTTQTSLNPRSLHMDGGEVFSFSLRVVPALIHQILADAGVDSSSIDAYLLHQANEFMLNHIGKRIGASDTRLPINISRYGNTSSASLPLLLADDMAPRLKLKSEKVLLSGFGVGLSWGAVVGEIGPLLCAEVIGV